MNGFEQFGQESKTFCLYCMFVFSPLPVLFSSVCSSSLLLRKQLVHVGYWKEEASLLVIGLPADR